MRDFRFGFTLATPRSPAELIETCRLAEAYGYDVAVGVDHLGPDRSSPFQTALAAAYCCQRMRVGSYVLDIGFWNPMFLAREVATVVRLSGGRFELGLGTGVIKAQFDAARIPWLPFGARVDRVADTLTELREWLAASPGVEVPPVLLGGLGERMLRLAANEADIVSFGGRFQVPGQPPATLRYATTAETEQAVERYRSVAGSRAEEQELNAFILDVVVTDDRRAAAAAAAEDSAPWVSVEETLDSPFLLYGTEQQIARQILDNRERFGFSYLSVQRPHMDVLGPVIEQVRRLAG
jgi:probable F420-dependent oxidoreductase